MNCSMSQRLRVAGLPRLGCLGALVRETKWDWRLC